MVPRNMDNIDVEKQGNSESDTDLDSESNSDSDNQLTAKVSANVQNSIQAKPEIESESYSLCGAPGVVVLISTYFSMIHT